MINFGFKDKIISEARKNPKKIVFPEGEEPRILKAAKIISRKKIAHPILLGDDKKISREIKKMGLRKKDVSVRNPLTAANSAEYADTFYALRQRSGISAEGAKEFMKKSIYYGTMMVYKGDADGLVSGSTHSTADTIRPALQIIKAREGFSVVSGAFFIVIRGKTYVFADCGVVEDPTPEELADIAIESAFTAKAFGIKPYVAMLSFSTKGSGKGPLPEKVVKATEIAHKKLLENYPNEVDIKIDGELQGDAALVPQVAQIKAPHSEVAGNARVLVFPDLDSGNIAYKLIQRLGGAEAYGPILQGLKHPVNDLSRGCSPEDIVGVTAITVVQAQMQKI